MFSHLYAYLARYKQLQLAGIGTVVIHTEAARSDFVNRCFHPPKFSITFEEKKETTSRKLFRWLATSLNISEREAVIKLNDFLFELKNNLQSGQEIEWKGVGKLKRSLSGGLKLQPIEPVMNFLQPAPAEKVIRENAEHTMMVGEVEKTSTQMTEILSAQPTVKPLNWWIWPAAIAVLIFIFLGWYFSEHGLKLTSTGTQQKISPAQPPEGFGFHN